MKIIIAMFTMLMCSTANAKDGRFQLYSPDKSFAGTYMIDTQTGKLWRKQCIANNNSGECSFYAWAVEDVEDVNIKRKDLLEMGKAMAKSENNKKN